jgi:hypothetical protein
MHYKFRARFQGGFWKILVFVVPFTGAIGQLTGTLTMNHAQWEAFKSHFLVVLPGISTHEVIEIKEN